MHTAGGVPDDAAPGRARSDEFVGDVDAPVVVSDELAGTVCDPLVVQFASSAVDGRPSDDIADRGRHLNTPPPPDAGLARLDSRTLSISTAEP